MDYSRIIKQSIVNAENEEGVVVFCDKEYIIIKYSSAEKKYNFELCVKNNFITFKDNIIQALVKTFFDERQKQVDERNHTIEVNQKKYFVRRKKASKTNEQLYQKNAIMLRLFGPDFQYPPYVEFLKANKDFIYKKSKGYDWYRARDFYW